MPTYPLAPHHFDTRFPPKRGSPTYLPAEHNRLARPPALFPRPPRDDQTRTVRFLDSPAEPVPSNPRPNPRRLQHRPPPGVLPCMMEKGRHDQSASRYDAFTPESRVLGDRQARAPGPAPGAAAAKPKSHRSKKKPATAIFIHAGAGFHSHENEKVHLQACQTYLFPADLRLSFR